METFVYPPLKKENVKNPSFFPCCNNCLAYWKEIGRCRRHAPMCKTFSTNESSLDQWPVTTGSYFCMEHTSLDSRFSTEESADILTIFDALVQSFESENYTLAKTYDNFKFYAHNFFLNIYKLSEREE